MKIDLMLGLSEKITDDANRIKFKRAYWISIASSIFCIIIFTLSFKFDGLSSFNVSATLGLLMSIALLVWSMLLNYTQSDQSKQLTSHSNELDKMLAGRQKLCLTFGEAMERVCRNFDFAEKSADLSDRNVKFKMYISSFALGSISNDKSLDFYISLLKSFESFLKSRVENPAITTDFELFVWEKSDHLKEFSITDGRHKHIVNNEDQKAKIFESLAKLNDIFEIYKKSDHKVGSVYLHEIREDNLRFFELEYDQTKSSEIALIVMAPNFGHQQNNSDKTIQISPDLQCLVIWDGTDHGKKKLREFFVKYSSHCCGVQGRSCASAAASAGENLKNRGMDYLKEYFFTDTTIRA